MIACNTSQRQEMDRAALFCADASSEIGGGHIRRCLVLADALRAAGWTCTFASALGSSNVVPQLAHSGHSVIEIVPCEHDALVSTVDPGKYDLAIVDHYQLNAAFERRCRTIADRILVIDDLANRSHDCDILVDPTLGRTDTDYHPLLSGSTELLLGPAHALLDDRFFPRRLILRALSESIGRTFVSFGAVDKYDLCGKAVAALRKIDARIKIDVAVGSASPNIAALQQMGRDDIATVRIEVDRNDMPILMTAADIAIGAAGGTGWERCCLGLPSLIITVADNQHENAAALQRAGAARWLGDALSVTSDQLVAEVKSLVADRAGRAAMRSAALAITDGLGANRVVSAVEGPVSTRDYRPVALRRVVAADCDLIFSWQSEPGARRYARTPLAPEYQGHRSWFTLKLDDPRCVFSVVLVDRKPVGVLRYDWDAHEQAFEISILISAQHQGQGIASAALLLGRRLLPDSPVIADVDPANTESTALFEAAGYRHAGGRQFVLPPRRLPAAPRAMRTRAIEGLH